MSAPVLHPIQALRAYLLIQSRPGEIGKVRRSLESIDGIIDTAQVSGPYDLIALVEVRDRRTLTKIIAEMLSARTGALRVLPCTVEIS